MSSKYYFRIIKSLLRIFTSTSTAPLLSDYLIWFDLIWWDWSVLLYSIRNKGSKEVWICVNADWCEGNRDEDAESDQSIPSYHITPHHIISYLESILISVSGQRQCCAVITTQNSQLDCFSYSLRLLRTLQVQSRTVKCSAVWCLSYVE